MVPGLEQQVSVSEGGRDCFHTSAMLNRGWRTQDGANQLVGHLLSQFPGLVGQRQSGSSEGPLVYLCLKQNFSHVDGQNFTWGYEGG